MSPLTAEASCLWVLTQDAEGREDGDHTLRSCVGIFVCIYSLLCLLITSMQMLNVRRVRSELTAGEASSIQHQRKHIWTD